MTGKNKRSILAVDDERDAMACIFMELSDRGHAVKVYDDFKDCMHDLETEEQKYDIAMIDLSPGDNYNPYHRDGFTGIDGINIMDKLKEKYPSMPVLCISCWDNYHPQQATMTVNAIDLQFYDGEKLEQLIEECIQKEKAK